MAKSHSQIKRESDLRCGRSAKTYKLNNDVIQKIADLSIKHNMPLHQVISEAVDLFDEQNPKPKNPD